MGVSGGGSRWNCETLLFSPRHRGAGRDDESARRDQWPCGGRIPHEPGCCFPSHLQTLCLLAELETLTSHRSKPEHHPGRSERPDIHPPEDRRSRLLEPQGTDMFVVKRQCVRRFWAKTLRLEYKIPARIQVDPSGKERTCSENPLKPGDLYNWSAAEGKHGAGWLDARRSHSDKMQ